MYEEYNTFAQQLQRCTVAVIVQTQYLGLVDLFLLARSVRYELYHVYSADDAQPGTVSAWSASYKKRPQNSRAEETVCV
jgi:hypothetical protein